MFAVVCSKIRRFTHKRESCYVEVPSHAYHKLIDLPDLYGEAHQ